MALSLQLVLDGSPSASFEPTAAIIAGWTGRDVDAVAEHIGELAAIGVTPPSTVPLYYRVTSHLFTTRPVIEVVGEMSSGEAEPILFNISGEIWLGLGSDHTDRGLEAHSVALSKQVCPKPIAPQAWLFSDVAGHLDQLELNAWIRSDPDEPWVPYQQGLLAGIRPLAEIAAGAPLADNGWPAPGTVMMCGTVPVCDGQIRYGRHFRMRLNDPVLGRQIEHEYETVSLPVVV